MKLLVMPCNLLFVELHMSTIADTGKLVDEYILKREERLKADKKAADLKSEENKLKGQLIDIAIKAKVKSIGGSIGQVNYDREDVPTVADWDKLYQYIWEKRAFDLLHKALTAKAVQERWEDKIVVPGVTTFPADKLTISGRNK